MLSPKRETIGGGGNVAALELAANDDMPCRVNSVDLKNRLAWPTLHSTAEALH